MIGASWPCAQADEVLWGGKTPASLLCDDRVPTYCTSTYVPFSSFASQSVQTTGNLYCILLGADHLMSAGLWAMEAQYILAEAILARCLDEFAFIVYRRRFRLCPATQS